MHTRTIMIAAGGTGGHLFPAQAFANDVLKQHPEVRIIFIGSGLFKNPYFQKDVFQYFDIDSATVFKKNPFYMIGALFKLLKGVFQSFSILHKNPVDVIVGFGSFHSFPPLLAARYKNIPVVLFESNSYPGRVNRMCSKWAKLSAVQFHSASEHLFSNSMCVHMPRVKDLAVTYQKGCEYYGFPFQRVLTVLIFGGSQGALVMNAICAQTMGALKNDGITIRVIHLVGKQDRVDPIQCIYHKNGVQACVKAFEPHMEYAWAVADFSISRSGASTIAENIAYTVPSILIPFPYGSEAHQKKNAQMMANRIQGAVVIEQSTLSFEVLERCIRLLLENNRIKMDVMRKNLLEFRENNNNKKLSSVVFELI